MVVPARRAAPPPRQADPLYTVVRVFPGWLTHYWQKTRTPAQELPLLAITQDRQGICVGQESDSIFLRLAGYCYLPAPWRRVRFPPKPRHLIFIGARYAAAIYRGDGGSRNSIISADRVNGNAAPVHRHHGYYAIAADEAA